MERWDVNLFIKPVKYQSFLKLIYNLMRSVSYIIHHLLVLSIIVGVFGYYVFGTDESGWWWLLGFVLLRSQTYTPEQWGHMYDPSLTIKKDEADAGIKVLLKD